MFVISSSLFNTEPGIIVDGDHTLTVDELVKTYAQSCDGGSICLICGKKLVTHMKRHMREVHHLSCDRYYCPTCDKFFKNRSVMYHHIRRKHDEWKGVDLDSFVVKK